MNCNIAKYLAKSFSMQINSKSFHRGVKFHHCNIREIIFLKNTTIYNSRNKEELRL